MNRWISKSRFAQLTIAVLMFFVCTLSLAATQQQIEDARAKGLAWLLQNQNGDGSWGDGVDEAVRASSSSMKALVNSGLKNFSYSRAASYLVNVDPASTDSFARKLDALQTTGLNLDDAVNNLISRSVGFGQPTGGFNRTISTGSSSWGAYEGYQTSFPDSQLATIALRNYFSKNDDPILRQKVTSIKLSDQYQSPNPDAGGWGLVPLSSDDPALKTTQKAYLLPTVYSLLDIISSDDLFPTAIDTQQAINDGVNWLINNTRNIDGGFSDEGNSRLLDTALVYKVLLKTRPTDPVTTETLDYLLSQQSLDGSWNADPFISAEILSSFPAITAKDSDNDGVPDKVELILGTNPQSQDSRALLDSNGKSDLGITSPFVYDFPFNSYAEKTLSVTGGVAPYTWSLLSGELPQGLTLSTNGLISGTTNNKGDFSFTYLVTDANGLSATSLAQLTINPTELEFSSPVYTVDEAGGVIELSVTRNNSAGALAVNYATSDGTAKSGLDYVANSGTLNFADGEASKSIFVAVTDDLIVEGKESLTVSLSGVSNGVLLGANSVANLVINDIEAGVFEISQSATTVNESDRVVKVTVRRVGGEQGRVTVDYATLDGSALSGLDYTATNGTLVFEQLEQIKTFTVPVLPDAVVDDGETFQVSISNPTNGALLGQITNSTITVLNSDIPITASNMTSAAVVEEDGGAQKLPVIKVSDEVGGRVITAELTLVNTSAGSLSTNDGASYDPVTGLWSISGLISDVNLALENVTFTPVKDWDADLIIKTRVTDSQSSGPDDGEWTVVMSAPFLRNIAIDQSETLSVGFETTNFSLSHDGKYLAYATYKTVTEPGGVPTGYIYRYSLDLDKSISISDFPTNTGVLDSLLSKPYISPDGRYVSFESRRFITSSEPELSPGSSDDPNLRRVVLRMRDFDSGDLVTISPVSDGLVTEAAISYRNCYRIGKTIFANRDGDNPLVPGALPNSVNLYIYNPVNKNINLVGSGAGILDSDDSCSNILQSGLIDGIFYPLRVYNTETKVSDFSRYAQNRGAKINGSGNLVVSPFTGLFEPYSGDASFSQELLNSSNGIDDLVYLDTTTGKRGLVTKGYNGQQSEIVSSSPYARVSYRYLDISDDGRYIVYGSNATNLVPNDTNDTYDVFLFDRLLNTTTLISKNSDGEQADGSSSSPAVSGNGIYVAFTSFSTNMGVANENANRRLYLYKRGGAKPDAPIANPLSISTLNDIPMPLSILSGSDVDTGDFITTYRIDSLPSSGILSLNSIAVVIGQEITQAEIDSGALTYLAAQNYNGQDSFNFSVKDSTDLYSLLPATVTINVGGRDITPPVITPPSAIVMEASGAFTPVYIGEANAIDDIDGVLTPVADNLGPYALGNTVVTWSVTDTSGNTGSATQIVTVTDSTAPIINIPISITVETNAAEGISVLLPPATATDIFTPVTVTNNAPAIFPVGFTPVTWTATDANGNSTSGTQLVTVNLVDAVPPVVTAPAAITIEATGLTTPVTLGSANATDDIDGVLTATPNNTGPFPLGTTTVTWSATDAAGNVGSATQSVTVKDTTAPVITVPAAMTVETNSVNGISVILTPATATDIFTPVTITNNAPALFPVGATTVIWSATDANGNSVSGTQLVTVVNTGLTRSVDYDFTGDGKADLITRTSLNNTWSIYEYDGTRASHTNFGTVTMSTDPDWEFRAATDFTGDSKSDVLVRNTVTGAWLIYELDGLAITRSITDVGITIDQDWQFMSASDFTGDGKADVLLRNTVTNAWQMCEFNGNVISSCNSVAMTTTADWKFAAATDFTGDGKADVLLRNASLGTWLIYALDGSVAVSLGDINITADQDWMFMAAADFSGDGKAGVLLRNTVSNAWEMYEFDGNAVFNNAPVGITTNPDWQFIVATDFSGNGKSDVLIRSTSGGAWYVYNLDGSVVSGGSVVGVVPTSPEWQFRIKNTELPLFDLLDINDDFNGDDKGDILLRNFNNGAIHIWEMDGDTRLTNTLVATPETGLYVSDIADFDADGKSDILLRNITNGAVYIWRMDGGTRLSNVLIDIPGPSWIVADTADFDGDGKADILVRNNIDGAAHIWQMDGEVRLSNTYIDTLPNDFYVAGTADFDNDGKLDIVIRNKIDGAVRIWRMDGVARISDVLIDALGANWDIAGFADFDGDLKKDILVRNGTDGAVHVWRMDGDVRLSDAYVDAPGVDFDVAGVGDFDGDGRADIIIRNSINGDIRIWGMNGNTRLSNILIDTPGVNWYIADIADFDLDGKADILLRNNIDGSIRLWLMYAANRRLSDTLIAIPGSNFDVANTADFDGDSIADSNDAFPNDSLEQRDDDGDGIGNNYELANGLDLTINDSSFDLDGDGFSNLAEFIAGSFANNAGSTPEELSFNLSTMMIDEAAGTVSVMVGRSGGGTTGDISVTCSTTDGLGSATSTLDYVSATNLLTWSNGDVSDKACNVDIVDDTNVETNETIQLDLSRPTDGAKLGALNTMLLTVVDNDAKSSIDYDFTGDGKADLITRTSLNNSWEIFEFDGTRASHTNFGTVAMTTDPDWEFRAATDFTGDSKSDVLVRNTVTGAWLIYEVDGLAITRTITDVGITIDQDWQFMSASDFTGDGKADVLLRNTVTNAWQLCEFNGNVISSCNSVAMTTTADWKFAAATDFTGDGKADVLLRNAALGTWFMYELNGSIVSSLGIINITTDKNWSLMGATDFSGNGKAGILLRNIVTNAWQMYEFDGSAIFNIAPVAITTSSYWQFIVATDFSGDGKSDVLLRSSGGSWYIYTMDGSVASGLGVVGVVPTGVEWQFQ